jgi:hypothetical protein
VIWNRRNGKKMNPELSFLFVILNKNVQVDNGVKSNLCGSSKKTRAIHSFSVKT